MSNSKKILIIDDNEDLAEAVKETLDDRGFSVSVANDGESGIEVIKSEKPKLILLDSMLPGMNGLDVLEQLQEYRKENKLNIIMFSNVDTPEELHKARSYNIDEYLIKTEYRMEEVIDKIKKYL